MAIYFYILACALSFIYIFLYFFIFFWALAIPIQSVKTANYLSEQDFSDGYVYCMKPSPYTAARMKAHRSTDSSAFSMWLSQ